MTQEIITNKKESFLKNRDSNQYENYDTSSVNAPFPKNSLVEISNGCNHACIFCTNPRMERKKGFLNLDVYEKFIVDGVSLGLEEVGLYTTGEPFLVKKLDDYIRIAKNNGIRYVYITTNGALATPDKLVAAIESGLDSIKFSVNAGSRDTYKLVHGSDDFDTVINNIKFLSNYRTENNIDIKLMASCVVTKFVEERDEKDKLKSAILPYVDDLAFWGVSGQMGQSLDQLHMIASSMTGKMPELGSAKPCTMLWNRLHVSCEGYLTLCCVDYENALTYADLNDSSLKTSWNNSIIQKMRERHQTQELGGTLCQNCLYGTRTEVYPLSSIGNNDPKTPINSLNLSGVNSVNKRIMLLGDQ